MRRRAKVDSTHTELVAYFRKQGASVADIHTVPGLPDLVVGYAGSDCLVEVKGPKTPVKAHQAQFQDTWRGRRPWVIRTVEEAEQVLAALENGG